MRMMKNKIILNNEIMFFLYDENRLTENFLNVRTKNLMVNFSASWNDFFFI